MSVRVERTPELRAGPPQLVARGNFDEFYNAGRNYDLAPDGRFIVTEKQELPPANRFVVVLGWLAELEDRMAAVGRQ